MNFESPLPFIKIVYVTLCVYKYVTIFNIFNSLFYLLLLEYY